MPLTPDAWIADHHQRQARVRRANIVGLIWFACFWLGIGFWHFLAEPDFPGKPDSQGSTLGECQPQTQTGENR